MTATRCTSAALNVKEPSSSNGVSGSTIQRRSPVAGSNPETPPRSWLSPVCAGRVVRSEVSVTMVPPSRVGTKAEEAPSSALRQRSAPVVRSTAVSSPVPSTTTTASAATPTSRGGEASSARQLGPPARLARREVEGDQPAGGLGFGCLGPGRADVRGVPGDDRRRQDADARGRAGRVGPARLPGAGVDGPQLADAVPDPESREDRVARRGELDLGPRGANAIRAHPPPQLSGRGVEREEARGGHWGPGLKEDEGAPGQDQGRRERVQEAEGIAAVVEGNLPAFGARGRVEGDDAALGGAP